MAENERVLLEGDPYSKIRCIALRGLQLRGDFKFFCSVNYLSWGGGECKSEWAWLAKTKLRMTPDSRLLKNSDGNRDGVWNFGREKEADIALFLQVKRIRNIRKIFWARETEHPTQTLVFTETATRQPGWRHCYLRSFVLEYLFFKGNEYQEIFLMLRKHHNITISPSTLKRKVNQYKLQRN